MNTGLTGQSAAVGRKQTQQVEEIGTSRGSSQAKPSQIPLCERDGGNPPDIPERPIKSQQMAFF